MSWSLAYVMGMKNISKGMAGAGYGEILKQFESSPSEMLYSYVPIVRKCCIRNSLSSSREGKTRQLPVGL
jgi:hypothetical protein